MPKGVFSIMIPKTTATSRNISSGIGIQKIAPFPIARKALGKPEMM